MPDILQIVPIRVPAQRVFEAVSTPAGLNGWWTARCSGVPEPDAAYELWFGPEYDWRGRVVACRPPEAFEIEIVKADGDWTATRVAFRVHERDGTSWLRFSHVGWPHANDHFATSAHCWALYLRILRRLLEHGERVPYERRLDA